MRQEVASDYGEPNVPPLQSHRKLAWHCHTCGYLQAMVPPALHPLAGLATTFSVMESVQLPDLINGRLKECYVYLRSE